MTFLLDTNVVSEGRRSRGNATVRRWLLSVDADTLHLSTIVIGEIRYGIERVRPRDPDQARHLEAWLDGLRSTYADRLIAIDADVADAWGRLQARITLPVPDGLIAATALAHDLTVAMRNVTHFVRAGVKIINPWDA